jgi:hypothetical protein
MNKKSQNPEIRNKKAASPGSSFFIKRLVNPQSDSILVHRLIGYMVKNNRFTNSFI